MIEPVLLAAAALLFDLGATIFHLLFWRIFAWPGALSGAGGVNSAIAQTLNVMLIFVFAVFIAATTWSLDEHVTAAALLGAGAGFWMLRAVVQPILFKIRPRLNAALGMWWGTGALLHAVAAYAYLSPA